MYSKIVGIYKSVIKLPCICETINHDNTSNAWLMKSCILSYSHHYLTKPLEIFFLHTACTTNKIFLKLQNKAINRQNAK